MFKWLFQGKKNVLDKAESKKKQEEESNKRDVADVRERIEYLFKHRTNDKGKSFTFADLEAATATQNPARQVSVTWLNDLVEGQLTDVIGCFGQLFAISDFFGVPSGLNFWFGDFTEDQKISIRVTNYFLTGQWQKVYDTESVVLQASDLSMISGKNQTTLYREALDNFITSSDFKLTLANNLLLSLEDSYLIIGITPDKTYKVIEEVDLKEGPFYFNSEKLSELKYLFTEGWDFEWHSPSVEGDPAIYLSVSVPDGVVGNQVKQGGPYFVQQLLDNPVNLEWVINHFHKRLDYMLGLRIPDPSITAHQSQVVALLCGIGGRALTVGDVRKMNKMKEDGQPLSTFDQSMSALIKQIEERSKKFERDENPE